MISMEQFKIAYERKKKWQIIRMTLFLKGQL